MTCLNLSSILKLYIVRRGESLDTDLNYHVRLRKIRKTRQNHKEIAKTTKNHIKSDLKNKLKQCNKTLLNKNHKKSLNTFQEFVPRNTV
jgi:hypothetical protein